MRGCRWRVRHPFERRYHLLVLGERVPATGIRPGLVVSAEVRSRDMRRTDMPTQVSTLHIIEWQDRSSPLLHASPEHTHKQLYAGNRTISSCLGLLIPGST